MRLFGKSKKILPGTNLWQDRVAARIASVVITIQNHFAVFLTKQTAKFSASSLKLIVGLFILCWFSASMYFFATGFTNEKEYNSIYIARLKHPSFVVNRSRAKPDYALVVTDGEYKKIRQFREYMDSLGKYASEIYDSILLNRPGLMDSITVLEQIYSQQKK